MSRKQCNLTNEECRLIRLTAMIGCILTFVRSRHSLRSSAVRLKRTTVSRCICNGIEISSRNNRTPFSLLVNYSVIFVSRKNRKFPEIVASHVEVTRYPLPRSRSFPIDHVALCESVIQAAFRESFVDPSVKSLTS